MTGCKPLLVLLCLVAATRGDNCGPFTSNDIEGPFFLADAPERQDVAPPEELEDSDLSVNVHGQIVDRKCKPLRGATIDIWYAGQNGNYTFDTDGDLWYRGQQKTDHNGRYHFHATNPGIYQERPIRHYHIKVVAKGKEFITQIYFKGEIPPAFQNYVKNRQSQIMTRTADGDSIVKFNIRMDV